MIYIFWTCRDKEEAKQIIHGLLNFHLIACATIYSEVESIYRWEGKIEQGQEAKVVLKTRSEHFETVQEYIKAHCSYEVPEILQVEIARGYPPYLEWVEQQTSRSV